MNPTDELSPHNVTLESLAPPPHPTQPLLYRGTSRAAFRPNKIVVEMLKEHPVTSTLASLQALNQFEREDFEQLVQLLGYRLTDAHALGYALHVDIHAEPAGPLGRQGRQPIQPLVADQRGVTRFKRNHIVCYLLDTGNLDLNQVAIRGYSLSDNEQFAQLHGYSWSGACSLSYFSDGALNSADLEMEQRLEAERQRRRQVKYNRLDQAILPAAFATKPSRM